MLYGNQSCRCVLALFPKVREIVKKSVDVSFSVPIVTFVRRVTNDMKGRKEYGKFWLLHLPAVCGAVCYFERYRHVHQKQKRRLIFTRDGGNCV